MAGFQRTLVSLFGGFGGRITGVAITAASDLAALVAEMPFGTGGTSSARSRNGDTPLNGGVLTEPSAIWEVPIWPTTLVASMQIINADKKDFIEHSISAVDPGSGPGLTPQLTHLA